MRDHTHGYDNEKRHRNHAEHHHGGRHSYEAGHHDNAAHRHHDPPHEGGSHVGRGGGGPHLGGRGGGPEFGHGGGGLFGGPRGRARRGEARYVLLDVLRDGPKHGYEIIKALEERSGGRYAPSPGTVYPTMQYLEDLGQVRSEKGAERRIYHLTDAGRAELEARAEDLNAFWARFSTSFPSAASQPEIGFLREDLDDLGRTVWGGLQNLHGRDDPETIRRVRQALERCRSEVRGIIAQRAATGE